MLEKILYLKVVIVGENIIELRSSRIKTRNTHGTGCTLASCIAAELAKGSSMLNAVKVITYHITKYYQFFFSVENSFKSLLHRMTKNDNTIKEDIAF